MKILKSSWMNEVDRIAIEEFSIPGLILMQNAAFACKNIIVNKYPNNKYKNILIATGPGNNGGDGYALALLLLTTGYEVSLITNETFVSRLKGEAKTFYEICLKHKNIKFIDISKDFSIVNDINCDLLIDSLLGTGLKRSVKDGAMAEIIKIINSLNVKVCSIDIPSGLWEGYYPFDGEVVKADETFTFQCLKTSLMSDVAADLCGDISILNIGIPSDIYNKKEHYIELIGKEIVSSLDFSRDNSSYKNNYGHVLVVAGSSYMAGAGILSAEAAVRSGSGLVTLAVDSKERAAAVTARYPHIMCIDIDDINENPKILDRYNVLVMGPGLVKELNIKKIVEYLIESYKGKIVFDAFLLSFLKEHNDILQKFKSLKGRDIILTPHLGEFSQLIGIDKKEIIKRKIELCRDFSTEYKVYLVLKGHRSIVSTKDGEVYINSSGNAGMATAGSGDVLSGIIGGLISSMPDEKISDIVKTAVFIHGYSGDLAAKKLGVTSLAAVDIVENLNNAFQNIHEAGNNIKVFS